MLRSNAKAEIGSSKGSSAALLDDHDNKTKRKAGWSVGAKDVVIIVLAVLLVISMIGKQGTSESKPFEAETVEPKNDFVSLSAKSMSLGSLRNSLASNDDSSDELLNISDNFENNGDSEEEQAQAAAEAQLAADEALNGAYPIQDDEIPMNTDSDEEPIERSPEELRLEAMASEEIERLQSNDNRDDWEGIPIESLGGLYIQDGDKYLEAPEITPPEGPINPPSLYKKMWPQLEMHEEFFRQVPHKRYIPRLGQPITRQQFHEIFRKTSTPVIIPFKYMRHLGVLTKGWTLKDLRKEFPYEPKIAKKTALMRQDYNQNGFYRGKRDVDFGPALWKLEQDTHIVYGASGTGNRNIPRNMKLPPSELAKFNISFPPFLPSSEFQPPTMWMGTTSADTKMHHDCCDNWVSHIQGTKRWFIAPPTDSRKLWPNACVGKHTALCWSPLKFPFRKNLTPKERAMKEKLDYIDVDVNAGEMLYLPAGWWHMISNRGPTIMINFWAIGCANSQIALDLDPQRTDRPDFTQCENRAKDYDAFIYS